MGSTLATTMDYQKVDRESNERTSLSTMQAERVRMAAEMNLQRETYRKSPSLRRKLMHIQVLTALEDVHITEPSSPPPPYLEVASEGDEETHGDLAAPDSECGDQSSRPESDEDDDSYDEWSSDEEVEDDRTLVRIVSYPSNGSLDAQHWAALISEATNKPESDVPVTASVVEIEDSED